MVIRAEDLITLEDGFKYWWPEGHTHGAYSAHALREIADHLDTQNSEWQQQIETYFNENKEKI